jgi:DNA-binding IclR family transcriptional regulator
VARPAPGADRSVAVLELLASHPDERFTLSEVARRCQLNKATAHALLSALSERGVLLRHPDEKRYSLGPRLISIGDAARRGYTAVDFVPRVLDALATDTGLWARAWRVTGDHIACVAQAGIPGHLVPSAPTRVPLVPPVGALFMAWSDSPTVEAWLARAPAAEAVRPTVELLPAIRQRRFTVMLASPEWRALSGSAPVNDNGAGSGVPSTPRGLLMTVAHQPLLVPDLDDEATYRPADVAAPVFGGEGGVELALSVTFPSDRDMSGAEIRALAQRVVDAADGLTAAVRGHHP